MWTPASGTPCPSPAPNGPLAARATVWRSFVVAVSLLLAGCAGVLDRNPIPEEFLDTANPYGIEDPLIWEWGDHMSPERQSDLLKYSLATMRQKRSLHLASDLPIHESHLAISGGGPDGAFSAGFLRGWADRGDRPEFTMVTGISTGAIVALFSFLGTDYNETLEDIYTQYSTEQLFSPTLFAAATGGWSLTDTSGFQQLIDRYVDDTVMLRLAEEYAKGRILLIGTTNLDAMRPVIWNITGIAASGHPQAKKLVRNVIQASSAIPAIFPPVLIPFHTEDGAVYDEMHVDGGATQQVMFFNPMFPFRLLDKELGVKVDRDLYVILNHKFRLRYDPIKPRIIDIAAGAASSLIGGSGSGDIFRLYAIAQRDNIDLHIMNIPRTFERQSEESFDPVYMRALYDLGRSIGASGEGWASAPMGFQPLPAE